MKVSRGALAEFREYLEGVQLEEQESDDMANAVSADALATDAADYAAETQAIRDVIDLEAYLQRWSLQEWMDALLATYRFDSELIKAEFRARRREYDLLDY